MERINYPPVYLGLFLLLISAVAAAMFAVAPPLQATVVTIFIGGVYGAGLYTCRKFGNENEAQFQQLANVGACLGLALFFGGLALSGIETGLILLLLTLQAGRNLVLATRRDLNFASLISLVLLGFAASKAMASWFVVFIVLYVLTGIFTFMADHIDARLSLAQGGDQELLTKRMNLPVKGVGLALLTLTLAFVIYLVVPRPPSPRLQALPVKSSWNYDNRRWEEEARMPRPGGQGTNGSDNGESHHNRRRLLTESEAGQNSNASEYDGFQNRFDVAAGGKNVNRPDTVALYLQTDNPLYVRGKVFDSFDGRSWEDSGFGAEKRYEREGRFSFGDKLKPGDVRQVFSVYQDLPPFIFAAYQPRLVSFPATVIETDSALTFRASDRLRKGTIYSVVSHLEEIDKHPCSGASLAGDEGRTADGRYLALYPGNSARLKGLALDVTNGAGNSLQKAKALESYLRNNFAYTLNTVGITWRDNPVEQFLFELKAGHCELFASSMVVLLRTLDIPARLVTGFYVHRYNPVTGYFEVRESDGHAWVEAYLEPHGWVTFEPTSSFKLPERTPKLFVATGLVRYLGDRVEDLIRKDKESWWAKSMQAIMLALFKLWLNIKIYALLLVSRFLMLLNWFMRGGWQLLVLLFGTVIGCWYLRRCLEPAWRLARLRRQRSADPQQFLFDCYREMERHFSRRGEARPTHLTPLEYEQLLAAVVPALEIQISLITRYFQQAAYGRESVTTFEAGEALRAFEEIHRCREPKRGLFRGSVDVRGKKSDQ